MKRTLAAFSRWFGSEWGVVQTFMACSAVIACEYLFPNVDPHWFWLLVWLTVYSAITQPALAYGNEKASRQLVALEERILKIEEEHGRALSTLLERSLSSKTPDAQALIAEISSVLAGYHDRFIAAIRERDR